MLVHGDANGANLPLCSVLAQFPFRPHHLSLFPCMLSMLARALRAHAFAKILARPWGCALEGANRCVVAERTGSALARRPEAPFEFKTLPVQAERAAGVVLGAEAPGHIWTP